MAIATKQRFRQLPLVYGNTVVGVVSIDDLVKMDYLWSGTNDLQVGGYITETYSG